MSAAITVLTYRSTQRAYNREDDVEGSLRLVLESLQERIEKQDGMTAEVIAP